MCRYFAASQYYTQVYRVSDAVIGNVHLHNGVEGADWVNELRMKR